MKIKQRWILLIAVSLCLSACSTFEGLQKDFETLGTNVGDKVQTLTEKNDTSPSLTLEEPICPPILVDPQLSSMTEFYDEQKTTPETKVSSVHLARASSTCEKGSEYLTVQIDLAFDGMLGPKARRKDGDQPFFAYPYFVTVTDNEGNEITKELFAASMTYTSDQNQQSIVETLRQKLPYNADGTLPPYQIHVGFQLNQSQLFYNASL